jgi:glutathione-regulated potassium-efflux system ancillary protein KefG
VTASVLILLAHPALPKSRANRAMRAAVEDLPGVIVHDLYETYPDFLIDIEAEQARIAAADVLVFQHPFYWYSAPAMVKEWLDLVLTHGFAYGDVGKAIAGKPWLQAITAGGKEHGYQPDGHNRFTVEELLRPFEATAHLCGSKWQKPFVLYAAHACDGAAVEWGAAEYRARIATLAGVTKKEFA